ncbi:MAG TPA: ATP-binding protein [Polyangiaceae bacterium]|nr:ATP-binding protein [Polyangiaceae bacterium]
MAKRGAASKDSPLRQQVLEPIAKRRKTAPASEPDNLELLHELEVHRIELEMQNDELRSAHAALEAGLDRYTQLFDFAPIGYATLASDGTVREVNHCGAVLLGELRKHIVGRRFGLFVASGGRATFNAMLSSVDDEEKHRTCELELAGSGDDARCARFTASSLAGREVTILLAFEDITAQKCAEARLQRADAALREADRRKDEFLAVLSHELRTPLSSIFMHAQLLQQGGVDDERAKHSGEVIERAAKGQASLIDDLLDVSRIIAGKLRLSLSDIDVTVAVQAAVDAASVDAKRRGVELSMRGPAKRLPVMGDATRLQQAVANLLTNALKFTPDGGRIDVTVDEVDRRASIRVRDTGVGIDPDFLPSLFVRFSQADRTTTRSTGGLGLGLSIAHAIVEAHHGTIRGESAGRGKGSTFTIVLPVATASARSKVVAPRPTNQQRIGGARLLVVEDDATTRATLADVLSRAGAEVRGVDSSAAAMAMLGSFKPDLLVCDISMPDEDGCTLLRRIRARGRQRGGSIPALALTALAGEDHRARTSAAGFDEHLVKPVDVERLLTTVGSLLSVASSGRGS